MRYITNRPTVVAEIFDDEAVVINMETGVYYSLEGSAGVAWSLLESGCTVEELAVGVASAYRSNSDELRADLGTFVEELLAETLLRAAAEDETGAEGAAIPARGDGAHYAKPGIKKYEDLQDLLLLDPIHEVDEETGWPNLKSESSNT
jgi:hypothetical protein